jgi:hypothetical protein
MNYYYTPASLYKVNPKEEASYYLTLWGDEKEKGAQISEIHDDLEYLGETHLIISQPWYEPLRALCYSVRKWFRNG